MSTEILQVPVAKPLLDEQEIEAVRRVILSGWVTQGPEVSAFEREFAEFVGADHACAVSNCTTALHLALKAVGISEGDEVVTVSHSFIATANAIRYCGAIPVFIDIESDGFNMNPDLILSAVSPRTKAILCVHQLGMPCNLAAIVSIAHDLGIPVIEDAACATGSEILWDDEWQKIGKPHGDIACFSFHPRKVITTGDGGMLTTSNADYDRKFRLWRQHGMDVTDVARHGAKQVIFEGYPEIGYNYRMTDLQAAVGRVQLLRMPAIIAARRSLASRYCEQLRDVSWLETPQEPPFARSNWQSYCVKLWGGIEQVNTMQALLDAGISTRRGIMNIHLEPCYSNPSIRIVSGSLALSVAAQTRSIILPLFAQMPLGLVDLISKSLVDLQEAAECLPGKAVAELQS